MTENWLYNKSASDNIDFCHAVQTPWSIQAQPQKSAWPLKTGTLEKWVAYAVDDSSFWANVIFANWGVMIMTTMCFPCIDFLWVLSPMAFDVWRNSREFIDQKFTFWSITLFMAVEWNVIFADWGVIITRTMCFLCIDFLSFLSPMAFDLWSSLGTGICWPKVCLLKH